jgi:hypothetical protein
LDTKIIGSALAGFLGGRRFRSVLELAFGCVLFERHKSLYSLLFTSYRGF